MRGVLPILRDGSATQQNCVPMTAGNSFGIKTPQQKETSSPVSAPRNITAASPNPTVSSPALGNFLRAAGQRIRESLTALLHTPPKTSSQPSESRGCRRVGKQPEFKAASTTMASAGKRKSFLSRVRLSNASKAITAHRAGQETPLNSARKIGASELAAPQAAMLPRAAKRKSKLATQNQILSQAVAAGTEIASRFVSAHKATVLPSNVSVPSSCSSSSSSRPPPSSRAVLGKPDTANNELQRGDKRKRGVISPDALVEHQLIFQRLPLDAPKNTEDNYDISDYEEDFAGKRIEPDRTGKLVPTWCANFAETCRAQAEINPDSIFGTSVPQCDLEVIFPDKLYIGRTSDRPKRRRGSSCRWGPDKLTKNEVSAYAGKMGQKRPWTALKHHASVKATGQQLNAQARGHPG